MNASRERAVLSGKRKLREIFFHRFNEGTKVNPVCLYFLLERTKLDRSSEPPTQLLILLKYRKAPLQPCGHYRQVCFIRLGI